MGDLYTTTHRCGGRITAGDDNGAGYVYCARCEAFTFTPGGVPDGTDREANRAAWEDGALRSPDRVRGTAVHGCGGTVRAYKDGFRHCNRCEAFTFDDDAPFPTGTDKGVNLRAWYDGVSLHSPDQGR